MPTSAGAMKLSTVSRCRHRRPARPGRADGVRATVAGRTSSAVMLTAEFQRLVDLSVQIGQTGLQVTVLAGLVAVDELLGQLDVLRAGRARRGGRGPGVGDDVDERLE